MGDYMRAKGYEPELVLCSTAERTKETLELVLPVLAGKPQIRYDRILYLAEWPVLLAEIRALASEASPLMVVGHNP
jgi:phosphohistidine phosphatase